MGRADLAGTAKRAANLTRIALTARKLQHDDQEIRTKAQAFLAQQFAESRGLPMKVGQFMSSLPQGQAFKKLTEPIEPMPLEAMLPVIEAGLSCPVGAAFASIEPEGIAASLGPAGP